MINDGYAFMDDTEQEKMQEERANRINSERRDIPIEDSLALFEEMLQGEEGWCLRAKIDMQSNNGCMRDPVLFRANKTPHHRTGTKYLAYPTYDFACPIVDSIEGVSHALRTTEYNDRDFQYKWLQEAMGLRIVKIRAFSRISFIYTLMSKRKLNWFVENRMVEGWHDPRFPTIQGLIRRGVSIDALREFILSQGASRRVVNMEWDVFWAANKKVYEPTAARYMGIPQAKSVLLEITNFDESESGETVKMIQVHPKDPQFGMRPLRLSNRVVLEVDDAMKMKEGKGIVLMRWGGVMINEIVKQTKVTDTEEGKGGPSDGEAEEEIVILRGELSDTVNIKKAPKVSWLADTNDKVAFKLVEFGHLITKAKLEDGDDFLDYVNHNSRAESLAWGDACLRHLRTGDVIQLERRGFYRVDSPHIQDGDGEPSLELFLIPDGKTKAMSTLTSSLDHI